jgi:hypothetical protein
MTDDDTTRTTGDNATGTTEATRTTDRRISRRAALVGGAAAVGALAVPAAGVLGSTGRDDGSAFRVRIENVSDGTTLQTTADGEASEQPVPLSPGAYAVHRNDRPIFAAGEPERDNGLEEVAEDGMPGRLVESLRGRDAVAAAGAFTTPVGADEPSPLPPGGAYEFTAETGEGGPAHSLSFVTMFVPSNDLFFAVGGDTGVRLFEDGEPLRGDVTDRVGLWDAGTEINEEPGVGENQVQRQRGANVGLVERGTVAPIEDVNGYDYPAVDEVLSVTVHDAGEGR